MGEETLEHAMRTCFEGTELLTDETLKLLKLQRSQEKKNNIVINNYYLLSLVVRNMLFIKAKSALEVNFSSKKILDRTVIMLLYSFVAWNNQI